MVLDGAEPFYFSGGSTGVLLLHGLTGSPAEMRLLGEALSKEGFTVLAVRLPGHGTIPEDLERATAGDWLAAAMDGYAILASDNRIEKIAVVGHSMGALLALRLAAIRRMSHVVSVAAPFFIREERGVKLLPPREKSKGMFLPKKQPRLPGIPARCLVGYAVMPLVSVHELLSVIQSAKEALPKVAAPLLAIQGDRDHTVAPESAEYIYEHISSEEKEIYWLEDMGHLLPIEEGRELVFERAAAFLQKGLQET